MFDLFRFSRACFRSISGFFVVVRVFSFVCVLNHRGVLFWVFGDFAALALCCHVFVMYVCGCV
jgi:hypothetical protein